MSARAERVPNNPAILTRDKYIHAVPPSAIVRPAHPNTYTTRCLPDWQSTRAAAAHSVCKNHPAAPGRSDPSHPDGLSAPGAGPGPAEQLRLEARWLAYSEYPSNHPPHARSHRRYSYHDDGPGRVDCYSLSKSAQFLSSLATRPNFPFALQVSSSLS